MNQHAKIKGRVTEGGMIINRCGVSMGTQVSKLDLVPLKKTGSLSSVWLPTMSQWAYERQHIVMTSAECIPAR